jgi:hypothetical protein
VIPKDTVSKGRPPDPRLLLTSTGREPQGPINAEEIRFTTGIAGSEGADTVTFCAELNFHPPQGVAVESSERHFALTTDPLNINVSPMLSNEAVVDNEATREIVDEVE